jgi:hypothetical protein
VLDTDNTARVEARQIWHKPHYACACPVSVLAEPKVLIRFEVRKGTYSYLEVLNEVTTTGQGSRFGHEEPGGSNQGSPALHSFGDACSVISHSYRNN